MSNLIEENALISFLLPTGIAVLTLLLSAYLFNGMRRLRRDQKVVMGGSRRDVVAHAEAMEQRVAGFAQDIDALRENLERDEKRLQECLAFRSVVRYDAYRDLSGMQSTSVALLDGRFSGIIISSIQSRDHARIYVKEVRDGESKEKLSPEEIFVLKDAMGLKAKAPQQVYQSENV